MASFLHLQTVCADIASSSKSNKDGQKWHDRAIRWANAALLSVDGGQYEPETGAVEFTIPHGQHNRCVALYLVLAGAAKAKRCALASEALLRAALRLHERCVGGQALFVRRYGGLLAAHALDACALLHRSSLRCSPADLC